MAKVHNHVKGFGVILPEGLPVVRKPSPKQCCCCGGPAFGIQWWNRDTGYGICRKCVEWQKSRGTTDAEVVALYGREGEHWGVHDLDR